MGSIPAGRVFVQVLALTALLAGCGGAPNFEKFCNQAADCAAQGGSPDGEVWTDAEIAQCTKNFEDSQAANEEAGCGEEGDAFWKCALKNAVCDEEDGEITGVYDTCDAELKALGTCIGGASSSIDTGGS